MKKRKSSLKGSKQDNILGQWSDIIEKMGEGYYERRHETWGIIGSRHFGSERDDNKAALFIGNFVSGAFNYAPLFGLSNPEDFTIISGGTIGTDTFVENSCKFIGRGSQFKKYLPNLKKYGSPKAYHVRNDKIIDNADKIVAFWNGSYVHSGTASVIRKCIFKNKKVAIFLYKKELELFVPINKSAFKLLDRIVGLSFKRRKSTISR